MNYNNTENLQGIQKTDLLVAIKNLAAEERKITLRLIDHLREVESRMLFAELGFGSLFEFCVKYLGLSEGSAHRRIASMRLTRDAPTVRDYLESGTISISNAAKLQVAFRRDRKLNTQEKARIIDECKNATQVECEKKLFKLIPEFERHQKSERQRVISFDEVELKLVLNSKLQEKIRKLKSMLAHSVPENSTLDLLEYLVDKELNAQERKRGINSEISCGTEIKSDAEIKYDAEIICDAEDGISKRKFTRRLNSAGYFETKESSNLEVNNNQQILSAIKKQVWKRANAKCEFPNCGSTYKLEIDHIQPKSMGGSSKLFNLRLLCRTHNVQQAAQSWGRRL